MRKRQDKLVLLAVTTSDDNHCSNDCAFMTNEANYCTLFKTALTWDKKRKYDGNKRADICKGQEYVGNEKEGLGGHGSGEAAGRHQ